MLRKTFMLLAAVSAASPLVAQTDRCIAHTITQRHLQAQGLSTDLVAAMSQVPRGSARGGLLTVPVVVHVVWNTGAENIPDASINQMVAQLNLDYQQQNTDLNQVRPAFTGVVGNVGVAFCLASVDPNGNATTGITRTQTTETWFDPDTETDDMKSPPKGISAWDPDSYLNIWVCDITSGATGGTVTVGYAYLPTGGVVGSNIDGFVIDYDYGFGTGERTATHEIGHYFGLLHPFDNNNCTNADGFTDTPTTDSPTFSCSNTNLQKCGVLTQYENFMDYASCSVMFTDQQSASMAGILTGARASLLSSTACGTVPSGPCIPASAAGTADGDYVDGVQLNTLSNLNTGGTSGPSYSDYTGSSTTLQRGMGYTINITSGDYTPDNYAAWIDYDQDDSFETNEKLGEFQTTAIGQTQGISFTVPGNAALGTARMRVRGVFLDDTEPDPTDPCFAYNWGETEDYSVVITNPGTGTCVPTATVGTADGDYVQSVQLGNIQNIATGGPSGPSYTDYTGLSADLARTNAYDLTITSGSYQPDNYAAWIDYDQDGSLEVGEKLGEFQTSTAFETQDIPFNVPGNAVLGNTLLRVRGVFINTGEPSPVDPCYDYVWGETEDYSVLIEVSTGTIGPSATNELRVVQDAGQFWLVLSEPLANAEVDLFDAAGQRVCSGRVPSLRWPIPTERLAAGVYQLVLRTSDRTFFTRFVTGGY
ncbi:MAG: hypothetical protein IPG10_19340 [Flavobacteriales bacterium]|nr:hypothetical protein [Flavobacteriales bacterium]